MCSHWPYYWSATECRRPIPSRPYSWLWLSWVVQRGTLTMPAYRGPSGVCSETIHQLNGSLWMLRRHLIFTYLFCCDLVVTLGMKKFVSPTLARCGGGEPGYITGRRSLVGLACCTINCGMTKFFGRFGDLNSFDGGSMSMDIWTVGGRGMGRTMVGVWRLGRPISLLSANWDLLAFVAAASDWPVRQRSLGCFCSEEHTWSRTIRQNRFLFPVNCW